MTTAVIERPRLRHNSEPEARCQLIKQKLYEEILRTYDDISLPTGVYLDMAKIVWRSGFFDHSVYCIS